MDTVGAKLCCLEKEKSVPERMLKGKRRDKQFCLDTWSYKYLTYRHHLDKKIKPNIFQFSTMEIRQILSVVLIISECSNSKKVSDKNSDSIEPPGDEETAFSSEKLNLQLQIFLYSSLHGVCLLCLASFCRIMHRLAIVLQTVLSYCDDFLCLQVHRAAAPCVWGAFPVCDSSATGSECHVHGPASGCILFGS